jgi:hypothetical protein
MRMRIFAASVIIAAVSLGMPVFVQAQGAPSLSGAQTPPAQSVSLIVVEFRAGKRAVQGAYSRDGTHHRPIRRRAHHCVCGGLLAIDTGNAQMNPKCPSSSSQ